MVAVVVLNLLALAADPVPGQMPNTWVKRSPLPGGPPSPGLGYEGSLAWDPKAQRVIRWAGHNQGGGGEQNAETWTFDPLTGKWELKEPNTSPPGACCNQQNLFDREQGRFLRFPAFSGSHGWHWFRENYLSNSTVWNYDLATNTWRDRRPAPAPRIAPLRCASWDTDHQVAVVFGGEGSREGTLVYDPYTNTWHRLKPKDEPPPRSGGNMAYDPVNKLHVLFGSQFDNDTATWVFDLRRNEWRGRRCDPSPPTDRNDPVLADDASSKQVIAVVRGVDRSEGKEPVAGHLETWAFDAAKFTWSKRDPDGEPAGWSSRRRVMVAAPELNLLVCEAFVTESEKVPGVKREQQMWTYRAAATPAAGPPPPATVRVRAEKDAAIVSWDRVPGADGYIVLRASSETPWSGEFKPVAKLGLRPTEFTDREVRRGTPAYYRVRAVVGAVESEASPVARAQPRVVDDLTAWASDARTVRLSWAQPPEPDAGYHVERAPVEVFTEDQLVRLKKDTPPLGEPSIGAVKAIGHFERITKEPLKPWGTGKTTAGTTYMSFTDSSVDLRKPTAVSGEPTFTHRFSNEQIDAPAKAYRFGVYAYRVRAVNALGVEGGPSAWVLTIPPAVTHVFAREDGTKCHLKWDRMPLENLKGYRVYRMESPRVNGPGQKVTRLTAEPIDAASFIDETGSKDTRRYWVVAVDRLGQEGIPSAPAWGWRQYRSVYQGFTGEWHQ